jgi:zinc protease
VVDVHAVWPGGLRNEDARSNGISNLLAVMLARGTKSRPAAQIQAELEAIPGTLSGFSAHNGIGLRAEFLSDQWQRGIELVADCILNPRFSDEDLEQERRVVLDQIRADERNPAGLALRLFRSTLWTRHPYRFGELGTVESVASLSRRRLVDHYRRFYGVSGLTIAVVGNVDTARVVAKIQSLLGGAAGDAPETATAATTVTIPVEPPRGEPAEVFRIAQDDAAHVVLGYPGLTLRDPDRFPLEVLSEILSGPQGRLAAALRDQRPSVYRVTASSLEGIDPGSFSVYLACSPQNLDGSVRAARAELARVVERGVTAEELARARQYLVGAHAIRLERRSAIAAALALHEAYGQGWREYRRDGDTIRKVSLADVQRVARKVLDPRREVVAVVKPAPASADLAPAVARRGKNEPRSDVAAAPAMTKSVGAGRSSAP